MKRPRIVPLGSLIARLKPATVATRAGTPTTMVAVVTGAFMLVGLFEPSAEASSTALQTSAAGRGKAQCSVTAPDTRCSIEAWDAKSRTGKVRIPAPATREFKVTLRIPRNEPYSVPLQLSTDVGDGVQDCTAKVTCESGVTIDCSVTGTDTTCNSHAASVSCFKVDDNGDVVGATSTCV